MAQRHKILQVRMLGRFSISMDGEPVDLRFGASTKTMQIAQLLLLNGENGVSSADMLEYLFGYEDVLSPKNNLKVSISQLRKRLSEIDILSNEKIVYKGGYYFWQSDADIIVDVNQFKKVSKNALAESSSESRIRRLINAVSIYRGNFLSESIGVDWVSKTSTNILNLYSQVLKTLVDDLIEKEAYEEAYSVLTDSYQYMHSEEVQVMRIDCMMRLGRWEEAKRIYQDTITTLANEFDVEPSGRLLEQYQTISMKTDNNVASLSEMVKEIMEDRPPIGAYFCSYPSFIDSCRVMARNMSRSGISCYLMSLSLCDRRGDPIDNPERLKQAAEQLHVAIQRSIRRGDSFTQYNNSQYLVFLFAINQENCDLAYERIKDRYNENPVRGITFTYQVMSCAFEVNDERFSKPVKWN